jgi:SAM-dependent methyltransferase
MPKIANIEAAAFWDSVTPTWLEMLDSFERITGEPGRKAMERLDPRAGERILDIGCGAGGTTLELAERVGADGEVLGVDIAPGLLERAAENAAARGVRNVSFLHADAQVHDLGRATFDAAFSRLGVMFFTDPVAAFANIRRSLRPGGRLSVVAWQEPAANEWMSLPATAAMTVLGTTAPPTAPDAPGPFSLADPDRVERILSAAGFHDLDIVRENDSVSSPEAAIPELARVNTRTGIVGDLVKDADYDTRTRVVAAIEAAMRSRVVDGEMHAKRGAVLVTARA